MSRPTIREAGRGAGMTGGSNPAKRAAKSISRLNRSAGPVSSRFSASSGVRADSFLLSSHGENVSTSMTPRIRSNE